tara:strand:+ start:4545 stop:5189 length:645 start_codon:yes stop_codon:yes gene_type:complete
MQFGMDMARNSRPAFCRDSHRERAVAEYLDYHLYPKHFQSTNRVNDKARQLAGIDLFATHKDIDGEMKIDEKAATSWAHKKDLQTFAFELQWMLGDEAMGGWFIDKERLKETTHWMCIWPRTAGQPLNLVEDIVRAEAALISVRVLRRWVRKKASNSSEFLEDMIERLRNGTEDELQWAGLRIRISRNLPEKPINLLIPRDVLRVLSEGNHWDL